MQTVLGYAKEYKTVPVMSERLADTVTPVNVFLRVKSEYDRLFLLESAENEKTFGRYSIIGFDPKRVISVKDGCFFDASRGVTSERKTGDPFLEIQNILNENICPVAPHLPKFTGGLAGYFGYDTARFVEKTLSFSPKDDLNIPDILLMDCDRIIVFDHLRQKVILITNMPTDGDIAENYKSAAARLADMTRFLTPVSAPSFEKTPDIISGALLTKERFCQNVQKAKEYIKDGDIFQVVLSNRVEIANPPDAFCVYRLLRASEPSPYMFYFAFDECVFFGSSPEKLVSLENGLVCANPIAGTIKRGGRPDAELEAALLSNEKERAEHVMLVDLCRNDLGRICEFGSVAVDKFMEIGRFSKLMHIISMVSGSLKPDYGQTDVLKACLPAGTLSGAPKIRAMQIIDELETVKRGLYGGAIGYLGYNGVMDACIAIRTALMANGKAYVQAGAGVVADSDPESEFNEADNKTKAVLAAFERAGAFNAV